MRNSKLLRILALVFAFAFALAACGDSSGDGDGDGAQSSDDDGGSEDGDGDDEAMAEDEGDEAMAEDEGDEAMAEGDAVTIDYWLWDENQLPLYQQCATDFTGANPGIEINIEQFAWGDYWDGLSAGFATGDVPDVFTDHLAKYPEFIDGGQLVALNDFVEADGVSTDNYFPGLADLWVSPDGERFGLPKDWDTVAIVTDQATLDEAGVTAEEFAAAEWNPDDGGTFEQIIARLSLDADGNTGDSADFDPSNVVRYGWSGQGIGAGTGQVFHSSFAASNGFEFLDTNPWGTVYQYDDPAFLDTMAWFRSAIEKGFIPRPELITGDPDLQTGLVASMTDGSWKIGAWNGDDSIDSAVFIPTPIGPNGSRASMFNGLADSITTASEHPEQAWEWVKYMAGAECQDVVGAGAVVFPALDSGTEIAQQAHADNGVDVSAFTTHVEEGTTFLFPIAGQAAEVDQIMGDAVTAVLSGEADVDALVDANAEVNELLAG